MSTLPTLRIRFLPDIQINQESVDALALIIHREDSVRKGREIAEKMKELVPRQMFDVAIQACIGVKVIARTNVKALRKNVKAKPRDTDFNLSKKSSTTSLSGNSYTIETCLPI
jgi:GTP-binding protein LepA